MRLLLTFAIGVGVRVRVILTIAIGAFKIVRSLALLPTLVWEVRSKVSSGSSEIVVRANCPKSIGWRTRAVGVSVADRIPR